MFNAVAARRSSNALMRVSRIPRTPVLPSRSIAFSTQPPPLQQITRTKVPTPYNLRISSALPLHHASTTLQVRSLSYIQRTRLGLKQASKGIWRKYPFVLPFAIICVIGSFCAFFYVAYVEVKHHMPQYAKYPPAVAKHLRTAVWYTEVDLNPPLALKSYKEAMHAAAEAKMHPYSDEVLGIKLQTSRMLEKAGLIEGAVKVLEQTRTETLAWIEKSKERARQNKEAKEKRKIEHGETPPGQKLEIDDPEVLQRWKKIQEFEAYEEKQRAKCIKKVVGMSLKLGELYESDHMQNPEKSEAAYESAVEIAMKELQSRESQGLPVAGRADGEDDHEIEYLTRQEVAVALTQLADSYVGNDKRIDLAIPVIVRALELLRVEEGSRPSCKQALLMSNTGGIWGKRAGMPFQTKDPEASRKQAYEAAKQWSVNALELSEKVSPLIRDEACDAACMLAMFNLGEIAEQCGSPKEAEKWYRDALALSKKIGDQGESTHELIAALNEGMERVSKK
ncbi:hypothetical protein ASPCAL02310 [Aspergillus calidoustus]|uniref:TPR domain protein n=1 Tax=Aspergillus calidoustus TaxID=454130 RepID=A0A0U4ZUV3_ASPCI|nr:hypothetical protein ASPCAL02310 [Aspergillus calidoustus]